MLAEFGQTDCRKDTGIGGTYDLQIRKKAITTSPRIGCWSRQRGIAIDISEQCSVVGPCQKLSVVADTLLGSGFVFRGRDNGTVSTTCLLLQGHRASQIGRHLPPLFMTWAHTLIDTNRINDF